MGKTLSMGYNKTIGEVISDANEENIELDKTILNVTGIYYAFLR